MVLYFKSNVVEPAALIYMGRDKVENELLIKYGFEEDVWFHVDKLSSAHVYLRLERGQDWSKDIPQALLDDCAQLVKANSIEGNKKDNITVVYTPWSNLKKTAGMATGQVSFHKQKLVKRIHVPTRTNAIVNRLNKTKVVEDKVDFQELRIQRDREEREAEKKAQAKKMEEEKRALEAKRQQARIKDYSDIFNQDNDNTVVDDLRGMTEEDFEEDFM